MSSFWTTILWVRGSLWPDGLCFINTVSTQDWLMHSTVSHCDDVTWKRPAIRPRCSLPLARHQLASTPILELLPWQHYTLTVSLFTGGDVDLWILFFCLLCVLPRHTQHNYQTPTECLCVCAFVCVCVSWIRPNWRLYCSGCWHAYRWPSLLSSPGPHIIVWPFCC